MTRVLRALCSTAVLVGAACGSVVQDEPDTRPDAPEFVETDDVPRDGPSDVRIEDGGEAEGETAPDAPDVTDAPDVEPECMQSTDCADDEPCNGDEICAAGVCRPGTPRPDGTACETASASGTCRGGFCVPHTCPNGRIDGAEGEECDDGASVPGDGCEPNCRYSCHVDADCPDDNPCTEDRCEPNAIGRICGHSPASAGTDCEDGNPCTVEDGCNGTGECLPGRPNPCDDGNSCTVDSCNAGLPPGTPGYPCAHEPLPTWFRDEDRDTFGDPSRTACAPECPGGYVDNDDDCCDLRPAVNPDHSTFEASPYRCGDFALESYDWNCNGRSELEADNLAEGTCRFDSGSRTCVGITRPGWCTSAMTTPAGVPNPCGEVPDCGEIGGWVTGCSNVSVPGLDAGTDDGGYLDAATEVADGGDDGGSATCRPLIEPRLQACR